MGRWCDRKIDRNRRDIYGAMQTAGCEDPEAALLEQREKAVERVRALPPCQIGVSDYVTGRDSEI
jgi:hypothetical protein